MTVCDRGEGGSKIIKKSVTYFMDGPKDKKILSLILSNFFLNDAAETEVTTSKGRELQGITTREKTNLWVFVFERGTTRRNG